MNLEKFAAGVPFPALSWDSVAHGTVAPSAGPGWRMLVIYRGKHCPLCKAYLNELNDMLPAFGAAQISVMTLSADPQAKAEAEVKECGWNFPVGYGLTVPQMRTLGLYVSDPRSPEETDRPFSEPALFVINPHGQAQIIDISNAPFARPALKSLLSGLQFVIGKDYPIRGRA